MKAYQKILVISLVLVMAVISMGAAQAAKIYDSAQDAMAIGNYAEAAQLFDSIGSYEDSSIVSMYCKACAFGVEGDYAKAIESLKSLGNYKDSSYYVTYFSGEQVMDKAKDAPFLYLDAADIFETISLFKDSAVKAEECRKTLYDAGVALMSESYDGARSAISFFEALGEYADSPDKLAECRKLAVITLKWTGANIVSTDYTKMFQYAEPNMYMGDLEDNQAHVLYCQVLNTGEEVYSASISATVDGEEYTWNRNEIKASASNGYRLTLDDVSYAVGSHHIVWYVNNLKLTEYDYEVREGKSAQKIADEKIAASIAAEVCAGYYNTKTEKFLGKSNSKALCNLFLDKLNENNAFILFTNITNNSSKSVDFTLSLRLDGETYTWNSIDVGSKSTEEGYWLSVPLKAGEHKVGVYYNNTLLKELEFTVYETMAQAEEQKLALTTVAPEDIEYKDTQIWNYRIGIPKGWKTSSDSVDSVCASHSYYYDYYLDQFGEVSVDIIAGQPNEEIFTTLEDFAAGYESDVETSDFVIREKEVYEQDDIKAIIYRIDDAGIPSVNFAYTTDAADSVLLVEISSEDHVSCEKMFEFIFSHIMIDDASKENFQIEMQKEALRLAKSKSYDKALAIYSSLQQMGYTVDEELINDCKYQQAKNCASTSPESALKILDDLSKAGYKDSASLLNQIATDAVKKYQADGNYMNAWNCANKYLSKITSKVVIGSLQSDTYNAAIKEYKNNKFVQAEKLFNYLPSTYKDTAKYLTLCGAHNLFYVNDKQLDELMEIASFEDAGQLLVKNTNNATYFFAGSWHTKGGSYSFQMTKHSDGSYSTYYTLPYLELSNSYFEFSDGIYKMVNDKETENNFKFTVVNKDEVNVYCYKDRKTYTLYRD